MTQLRYLSTDEFQFHKQVLSFLRFLKKQDTTVVYTSQNMKENSDDDLQFMSDGIIHLEYGNPRKIEITKFRGSDFQSEKHSLKITESGMEIFPKISPKKQKMNLESDKLRSGVSELDELLNGGIQKGTTSIISGPSGVGKTTTGAQFIAKAAENGEKSVLYMLEENKETFINRCESINIPIKKAIEKNKLLIKEIPPLQISVDEFTYNIRKDVEENDAKFIIIDSIGGYQENVLESTKEELIKTSKHLKNKNITTFFINEISKVTGEFQVTEGGTSQIADNILFLRYIEHKSKLRKSIGVLKKRTGSFEKELRELKITEEGIKVGEPLTELRGILKGTPEWTER